MGQHDSPPLKGWFKTKATELLAGPLHPMFDPHP